MRFLIICLYFFTVASAQAQDTAPPFAAFDLASPAFLNDPHDLAIGPEGHLYVADKFGNRLAVLDAETLELIAMLGEGRLPGVHDVSFDDTGRVAVAVTGANAVAVYANVADVGKEPDLLLSAPRTEGVLAHSSGRIFAMASGIGSLLAYDGSSVVALAEGHLGAHDVAEGPDGNIWIADNLQRRLVQYTPDLRRLRIIDAPKFGFVGPRYLDVDDFGNLVVADQDAHRILLIDPEGPDGGTLIGVLGNGSPGLGPNRFDDPEGVAVIGNRFYVSDSDNNRIVRYSIVLN